MSADGLPIPFGAVTVETLDRLTAAELDAMLQAILAADDVAKARLPDIEAAARVFLQRGLRERIHLSTKIALLDMVLAEAVEVPVEAPGASHAEHGPAQERLLAGRLLLERGMEIPVDEADVVRATDPAHMSDPDSPDEVYAGMVALLRTASYYVLVDVQVAAALASEPPEEETFPPLPFRRVWLETHNTADAPSTYLRFTRTGSAHDVDLDVIGVGIVEVDPGQVWDVYVAVEDARGTLVTFLTQRITPSGFAHDAHLPDGSLSEAPTVTARVFREIRRLAVGGAHLVTAKNVPHHELTLPRHQRKRLRRTGQEAPRVYFVDLAASGERSDEPLRGGREYHCRWLVRGHWRSYREGVSEKGRVFHGGRMWIAAYVKGPVGAPWKGRPVHKQRPQ